MKWKLRACYISCSLARTSNFPHSAQTKFFASNVDRDENEKDPISRFSILHCLCVSLAQIYFSDDIYDQIWDLIWPPQPTRPFVRFDGTRYHISEGYYWFRSPITLDIAHRKKAFFVRDLFPSPPFLSTLFSPLFQSCYFKMSFRFPWHFYAL